MQIIDTNEGFEVCCPSLLLSNSYVQQSSGVHEGAVCSAPGRRKGGLPCRRLWLQTQRFFLPPWWWVESGGPVFVPGNLCGKALLVRDPGVEGG